MYFKLFLFFIICILLIILYSLPENFEYSEKQKNYLHNELLTLCKKITDLFDEYNITYFIHSGTLLGSVREGNIIPHDDDIDIAIFPNSLEFILSSEFEKILKENGLRIIPFKTNKGILKLKSLDTEHGIFIDIFVFRKNGTKYEYDSEVSRNTWKNGWFSENELFPLKTYQLGNLYLYGPIEPHPYLKRHFGNDWMIPKKRGKNHQVEISLNENCYGKCL